MEAIQPLLDLLGGSAKSWLTTAIAWFFALRLALVFVHDRLKRWISDKLNAVAASESQDDDEILRRWFSHPRYKFAVFIGLAIGIPLPSINDLERAIRLQNETASTANPVPVSGTKLIGLFLAFALPIFLLLGCANNRLEPGGAYAPVLTNDVGQVTAAAEPDMALFVSDSTYDLAYNAALTVFRIEKNNRALLKQLYPDLKKEMDRLRDQVWEADGHWAEARQAYLANPVPANLDALNRTLAELQRLSAAAETLLPKESP